MIALWPITVDNVWYKGWVPVAKFLAVPPLRYEIVLLL